MSRSTTSRVTALAAAGLAAAGLAGSAFACSICLCGDPAAATLGLSAARGGQWKFGIESRALTKSNALDDDPTGTEHEREARVAAQVTYVPVDRLTVGVNVPFLDRTITEMPSGDRATTKRLSDVELQARYDLARRTTDTRFLATQLLASVTAPTGANDLVDESGVRRDEHQQAGSGAWGGSLGLAEVVHFHMSRRWVYGSVAGRTQGTNTYGYRYGNSLLVTLLGGQSAGDRLTFMMGAAGRSTARDHTGDTEAPLLADSGGQMLFATPGAQVMLAPGLFAKAQAYVPVWDHLNGTQSEKANFVAGFTYVP